MSTTTTTPLHHQIEDHSRTNGGGTFDPTTGEPITTGTAVTVVVLDTVTEADLPLAIYNAIPLVRPSREGAALGTWFDFENGVWEVSITLVTDFDDALDVAASLDERYVYDIDADECVAVPAAEAVAA